VKPTGTASADIVIDGGVAGGALGPDLSLGGLDATDGLMIDGNVPTFFSDPGDTLFYDDFGPAFLDFGSTPGTGAIYRTGVLDVNFRDIEFIDSINPLGIVIDADDLVAASNGALIRRVVYVSCETQEPDLVPAGWFDVKPGDDAFDVASTLGDPVAELIIGNRLPSPGSVP